MAEQTERNAKDDLALCNAATPGPWTGECGSLVNWRDGTFTMEFIPNRGGKPQYDADLNFMAMAREALPWYIRAYLAQREELEQLRAENDSLHVVLQEANDTIERMSREQSALARLRAWRAAAFGRWFNLENDIGCPDCLVLGELQGGGHQASRLVTASSDDEPHTEDKPASLGEMADVALAEWERKYKGDEAC